MIECLKEYATNVNGGDYIIKNWDDKQYMDLLNKVSNNLNVAKREMKRICEAWAARPK